MGKVHVVSMVIPQKREVTTLANILTITCASVPSSAEHFHFFRDVAYLSAHSWEINYSVNVSQMKTLMSRIMTEADWLRPLDPT